MKILVDKEAESAIMELVDIALKTYGASFLSQGNKISNSIIVVEDIESIPITITGELKTLPSAGGY